jgi:tetratricopeptide (TPR) repeat protein
MSPSPSRYDAFISYSHAKDRALAIALQGVIQTLGKPWYRRRSLRVFRDEGSLSSNPALWPSIEEALANSGHFILLACPEAAASEWVCREVEWWRKNRDASAILLALTEGELTWDAYAQDFKPDSWPALPAPLKGAFKDEPYWTDFRDWRDPSREAKPDRRFVAAAAGLVSAINGVPKDDLISEELRRQRRTIAIVSSVAALLALLVVAASTAALLAVRAQRVAQAETESAKNTLELASGTAGNLLDNLDQKYRDSSSGPSGQIISDINEQVRMLYKQLKGASSDFSFDDQMREAAVIGSRGEALKDKDPKLANQYAVQAKDLFQGMLIGHPKNYDIELQLVSSYRLIALIEDSQRDKQSELDFKRENTAAIQLDEDHPGAASSKILLYKSYEDIAKSSSDPNIDRLSMYNKALSIVAEISYFEPANLDYKAELVRFNEIVGRLYKDRSNYNQSMSHYKTAMDVLNKEEETKPGPDNKILEYRRADIYEDIGDLHAAQTDFPAARISYETAFEIYNRFSQKDNIGDLVEKRYAESRLGDFAIAEKNYGLAKQHYDQALAIAKQAVEMAPNVYRQRDLIASLQNVGDVCAENKDDNEALNSYQAALKAKISLSDTQLAIYWLPDLPKTYERVGDAQLRLGAATEALKSFQAALEAAQKWADINRETRDAQNNVGFAYSRVAKAYQTLGANPQARAALESARAIFAKLVEAHPDDALAKRNLDDTTKKISELSP